MTHDVFDQAGWPINKKNKERPSFCLFLSRRHFILLTLPFPLIAAPLLPLRLFAARPRRHLPATLD